MKGYRRGENFFHESFPPYPFPKSFIPFLLVGYSDMTPSLCTVLITDNDFERSVCLLKGEKDTCLAYLPHYTKTAHKSF